jgi:mannose-6-phosphate isomerase
MKPLLLPPNRPRLFYRGGSALAEFRGVAAEDDYRPEDWLGSTTTRNGAEEAGLTRLPDGELLRDAIRADAEGWLGAEHAATIGADPGLLVKLLDAGERLPVHVHPGREFARQHLDCAYGKTEAWVVLGAPSADARVHLGFTRDVEAEELDLWRATQDSAAMLGSLHAFEVAAGDAVFVPAGMPHAIGAGVFCLELQEPTDLSLLLEWEGFGELDRSGLAMGLDAALARECVQRGAVSAKQLAWLRTGAGRRDGRAGAEWLFPAEADAFFRAERIDGSTGPVQLEAGFGVLVVLGGEGELRASDGAVLALARGAVVLIPFGAGEVTVSGAVTAVCCRPPDLTAAVADGIGSPRA